jgi:hypothetical protein
MEMGPFAQASCPSCPTTSALESPEPVPLATLNTTAHVVAGAGDGDTIGGGGTGDREVDGEGPEGPVPAVGAGEALTSNDACGAGEALGEMALGEAGNEVSVTFTMREAGTPNPLAMVVGVMELFEAVQLGLRGTTTSNLRSVWQTSTTQGGRTALALR